MKFWIFLVGVLMIVSVSANDLHCYGNECCEISNHIIDYSAGWCCPPDSPFYITSGMYKNMCGVYNTGGADNYYTRLSQCNYFYSWDTQQFTQERVCFGYEENICVQNNFITSWKALGLRVGACGYYVPIDDDLVNDEPVNDDPDLIVSDFSFKIWFDKFMNWLKNLFSSPGSLFSSDISQPTGVVYG